MSSALFSRIAATVLVVLAPSLPVAMSETVTITNQGDAPAAFGLSNAGLWDTTFPDGGAPSSATTGDIAYMGGAVTVDFHWTARG